MGVFVHQISRGGVEVCRKTLCGQCLRCRPRRLTPEEDSVLTGEGDEDGIDETLPADLWFRFRTTTGR